jgi:hypothetical protein
VNQGSANLVVSKDGSVKYTLPITVGAARYLYAVTLDQNTVTIGDTEIIADYDPDMNGAAVVATAVDQYNTPLENVEFDEDNTAVRGGACTITNTINVANATAANGKTTVEVVSGASVGTSYFTLAFSDPSSQTTAKASLTVKVVSNARSTGSSYALKAVLRTDDDSSTPYATGSAVTKTFDMTGGAAKGTTTSAIIRAVKVNSYGVITDMSPLGGGTSTVSLVAIKVVDANDSSKVYAATGAGFTENTAVSSTAITAATLNNVLYTTTGAAALVVNLSKTDSTGTVTKTFLPAGSYKVTYTTKASGSTSLKTITETFTVKNSLSVSVKINATNIGKDDIIYALAEEQFATYTVNGQATTDGESSGVTVTGVYGTASGSTAYIDGVLADVPTIANTTEQVYIPIKQTFYANSTTQFNSVRNYVDLVAKLGK